MPSGREDLHLVGGRLWLTTLQTMGNKRMTSTIGWVPLQRERENTPAHRTKNMQRPTRPPQTCRAPRTLTSPTHVTAPRPTYFEPSCTAPRARYAHLRKKRPTTLDGTRSTRKHHAAASFNYELHHQFSPMIGGTGSRGGLAPRLPRRAGRRHRRRRNRPPRR